MLAHEFGCSDVSQKSKQVKRQQRLNYARDRAAELAHLAMRLQRCKQRDVGKLVEDAHKCLLRFKMASGLVDQKNIAGITEEVAEDLLVPMQSLGDVIRDTIAPHPYALLVFDSGGMMYKTNANIDDVCIAMGEFIDARAEAVVDPGAGS